MAGQFKTETVSLGTNLVVEGGEGGKFFVIAQGQVEVLSKGVHGSDLRLALLTDGEYLGEEELTEATPSTVSIRTTTPCVLATLSRKRSRDLPSRRCETPSPRPWPSTRSFARPSTATASGTSTSCQASPKTSRFRRPTWSTRPRRGNTRFPPCKRSSAYTPASRTCTTAHSISSKNRCGWRSKASKSGRNGTWSTARSLASCSAVAPSMRISARYGCADAGRP